MSFTDRNAYDQSHSVCGETICFWQMARRRHFSAPGMRPLPGALQFPFGNSRTSSATPAAGARRGKLLKMRHWTTRPLPRDLDFVGPIELRLDAACTAPDTAFIAVVQDVDEEENAVNFTAGYLRAGLRGVNVAASKPGARVLTCLSFEAVPIGERVTYRLPLIPNSRRFRAGHKLRPCLTTDDQNKDTPAMVEFKHATVGTSSLNTIFSSSRLFLPVIEHGS
jgi:predicted acyl esterase